MPAMWAMAAGTALDFAGGLMDARAGASTKTIRRRGIKSLNKAQSSDALFAGLERAELLKGQSGERQGFEGARKALDLGAMQGRQGLMARGAQNQAAAESSIVNRGLLGTSTGRQKFNQVGDQTSMQLAALDAALAQQYADLGLQEGQVLGQQGRERTALAGKNRAYQNQIDEGLFSIYTMG